jgi:hypothetical protein
VVVDAFRTTRRGDVDLEPCGEVLVGEEPPELFPRREDPRLDLVQDQMRQEAPIAEMVGEGTFDVLHAREGGPFRPGRHPRGQRREGE